jgi:dTDP-4-amino-4,6-dideoxygalactose transaminase
MSLDNIIIKKIKRILGKKKNYYLHEPFFFGNEKKYLLQAIKKNYVSSIGGGKFIDEFEKRIKNFTKTSLIKNILKS